MYAELVAESSELFQRHLDLIDLTSRHLQHTDQVKSSQVKSQVNLYKHIAALTVAFESSQSSQSSQVKLRVNLQHTDTVQHSQ